MGALGKDGVPLQSHRKRLAVFFVLVFAFSVPFWVLGMVYEVELLPGLPVGSLAAFTPSLAAIFIMYRYGRLSAVSRLLYRSFDLYRIEDKKWYLVFVLFNPIVALMAYWVTCLLGFNVPALPLFSLAIVPLFIVFFFAALGEELGWTGYATEQLLSRWGILRAGMLLGLVWAAFHIVALLQANRSFTWIAWWALHTVLLRIVMVWLYSYGGSSVFAAAIFHSMINLSWQLFPINGSLYDPRIFSLVTLVQAILLVTVRKLVARAGMAGA